MLLHPTGAGALVAGGLDALQRQVELAGETWDLYFMMSGDCDQWTNNGYGVGWSSSTWTVADYSVQSPTPLWGVWYRFADSVEVVFVLTVMRVDDPSIQETGVFSLGAPSPAAECGAGACPATPRYFMYTLEDEDQPAGWQPYCYIISSNGSPSTATQARVCSVPGSDHVFRATNVPYAGWVYADCHGKASYGWPEWDPEWYRP
jgi:hypothetical protein